MFLNITLMAAWLQRRGQQLLLAKVRNASGRIGIFSIKMAHLIMDCNLQSMEIINLVASFHPSAYTLSAGHFHRFSSTLSLIRSSLEGRRAIISQTFCLCVYNFGFTSICIISQTAWSFGLLWATPEKMFKNVTYKASLFFTRHG